MCFGAFSPCPSHFPQLQNQTHQLVSQILRCDPGASSHIAPALAELAEVTGNPDWHSLKDVDIPFQQWALSRAIDQANYATLIDRSHNSRSRALALSTAIPHARDWLPVVPSQALGYRPRTGSSAFASSTGWDFGWWRRGPDVLSGRWTLTPLGTIRLVVEVMGTEFTAMSPSGTHFSQQLSQLH